MKIPRSRHAIVAVAALVLLAACSSETSSSTTGITVSIAGGFETEAIDNGRPVVLIAAALGVSEETFRAAFGGVNPADPSEGPSAEQAQANKAALLSVLGPLGITNDRLDEVSDYYRYNRNDGDLWPTEAAEATAVVTDGVVTSISIVNPGSGYTSTPVITVAGAPVGGVFTANIDYTNDFETNGSIGSITLP